MSRTVRTERHWFDDTRRWQAQDEAEGRTPTPAAVRFARRPLTADGRFADTNLKGPTRNRRARRVARQGRYDRAGRIAKEWLT